MPDESSASKMTRAGKRGKNGRAEPGAVGSELDLAAHELAETNGVLAAAPADRDRTPSSERGATLESEHWRERAIVWRERAMGAELVAKMLQRNLDDLRANLEDLRRKIDAAAADAERTAAIASSEPPWRRFVRDVYDKYFG
jgi:hypothetical protein